MSVPRLLKSALDSDGNISFKRNGIGYLTDCISCVTSETINNLPTIRLEYPMYGSHAQEIVAGRYIVCKPNEIDAEQLFKITKVTEREFGNIAVSAEHCARQLKESVSGGFDADTAKDFVLQMNANAYNNICNIGTKIDAQKAFRGKNKMPRTLWSLLVEEDASFIGLYGGELKFNNFTVSILQARGADRGLVLQHGINVSNITRTTEYSRPATAFYPFWYMEDQGYVDLPEKVLTVYGNNDFDSNGAEALDLTFDFSEKPTEQELREKALYWIPKKQKNGKRGNIQVDFFGLPKSQDEKTRKIPIGIGDIVRVNSKELHLMGEHLKVVSLDYDVLSERVQKIGVGDVLPDFADLIISITRR